MKLLIVDDNTDNRYYFEKLLQGLKHAVVGAANGAEALEKLKQAKFDLVISDVMMPVMDGFHLLQECRKDPEFRKIPFIFVTGVYLDQKDEELANKLGVRVFLHKPVEPSALVKAINDATAVKPSPAKRGRKPKSEQPAREDKLLEERPATTPVQKLEELESATTGRKQAEAARQEKEEQYRLLFETMSQGVVYYDAQSRIISANPSALQITGLTTEQITGRTAADPRWRAIHEDGREYSGQEHPVMVALRSGQPVKNTLIGIFNTREEKFRWLNIDAIPLMKPEEGKPYLVYTTITDVTDDLFARKAVAESEARLHAILENTDAAIFSLDRDFRLITANTTFRRRFEEFTGRRLIEGMDIRPSLHHERRAFWEDITGRVLKGEYPTVVEHYEMASGGYDIEFSAYPIVAASGYITGFSFFGRDITEKNRAAEIIEKNSRLFKMLFLCNEAMVHAVSEEELLGQICRLLVDIGGYKMAWVGEALNDEAKTIRPIAFCGTDESYINAIKISWADTERGRGPAGKAIRTGQTIVLQNISKDADYRPWHEEAAARGYAGKVSLPLKDGERVFGVLNIYASQPDFFTDEEVALLEQLAEDVSYGIASLRTIEQRQNTEASLRESEERFRIASQSTSDLVWDWDIAGGRVEWYGKIDDMLGYASGEFPRTLQAWENALYPEDHDRVMAALNRHAETGEPYEAEYRIIRKDGGIHHWIDRGLVLRDSKGEIKRSIGACIDITERRQSQQRSVIRRELALKIAASSDLNYALQESLEAAVKIAGCDSGAIHLLNEKGNELTLVAHTGFPEHFIRRLSAFKRDSDTYRLIMTGEPQYLTLELLDPGARQLCAQEGINFIALTPIHYRGSIIGCMGVCSHRLKELGEIEKNSLDTIGADIENVIERIRSRSELEKSEERYRFITAHIEDVIWAMDKYLRYTYFSPSVIRQRGYTPEEMLTIPLEKSITPDSLERLGKILENRLAPAGQGEKPEARTIITELELYRRDGATLWSETSMTLLFDKDGNFNGLLGISRDITERKKAEAALRESEEKYRTVLDEMDQTYFEIDSRGNYTFFNDTLCRHLGYTREEAMGMNYKVYTPPEDYKRVVAIFSSVYATGIPARNVQMVHITRDGRRRHIENSVFAIRDGEGKITGLRGLGRDITDRVKSEEELCQRALLLDAAYDSIIAYDPAGVITYANEAAARARGYNSQEMLGMNIREFVPPENVPLLEKRLEILDKTGELTFEVIHIDRDGRPLELEARIRAVTVNGQRLNIAVYRDLTERNKMQKELVDREARYRSIIETAGAAVVTFDVEGRLTYINDLTCRTLGYTRDEMIGKPFIDFIHPDDREKALDTFTEAASSTALRGPTAALELRLLHKDGNIVWFYANATRLMSEGKTTGFSVVMPDITRLKQAEADLMESEQRYRSLFENNPVAVYMQDVNGHFIGVNDATCRITGYSREELLGLLAEQIIAPEEIEIENGRRHFIQAIRGEPQTYEHTIISKDGRRIRLNVTNTAVKVNERIVGVYGIAEDITERKKAEADLKAALEMVSATLEGTIDAIAVMSELRDPYTAGHQRLVAQLAVAIAREIGLPEEQISGLRVAGLLHDVGKINVPSEILSKPGKLSDLEKNLAKSHAEAGYEIVKTIKFPWPVAKIIRQHHERMDGSGYPHGLKGEEIILEARILAVADVVEAMMSHRPYRPALGVDMALEEISSNKDILYYGPAVEACIILFREKGFAFSE